MSANGATGRLLIVGNPDPVHVGAHLLEAACALGLAVTLADARDAFAAPIWQQKWAWWLRGHRPPHLEAFSQATVETARSFQAEWVLTVGLAPLDRESIGRLRRGGVTVVNFLTDDPWNRAHQAGWFLEALGEYDAVFSPRRRNLDDLAALAGPSVHYLPFAYAPTQHFIEPPVGPEEQRRYDVDLLFAGGADADRVAALGPLIAAGFDVALYGGYWERFGETRRHARGMLTAAALRKATRGAKVCLGLVRRANRDGHSMRSYEVPAMGGCLLVEDTADHRAMFGADGDAVAYFSDAQSAVHELQRLLADEPRRRRLAESAHQRICGEANTYRDRLSSMLQAARVA